MRMIFRCDPALYDHLPRPVAARQPPSEQRVARLGREPIVIVVAILIGVAGHGGADRPPAAYRDHAGRLPVIEK